jgi:type IV pilus assembly protein PilB
MATEEDLLELGVKPGSQIKICEKTGCSYCNNTGYQGRTAVYEIMEVNPEIKDMIVSNASTADIKRVAVQNGMHTLHRSAAELVIRGITTMQEMRKVSSEK